MSTEAAPKKSHRYRRWLIELTLLGLVVFAIHAYQTRATPVGDAPPLAGIGLQGESVDLAQLRGRPVLVYFWSSWCPICRVQQSAIRAIAEDSAVLSVAWHEEISADALRDYAQQAGYTFPVLRDVDGSIGQRYGIQAVPTAFVIDPGGEIRFTEVGYTTTLGLRIRLWLADMLPR
jgi:peroxiredoxin